MRSSYLCLIGVAAVAMAFPGCAMDNDEKGAYNATYDAVEVVKKTVAEKDGAIKGAMAELDKARDAIKQFDNRKVSNLSDEELILIAAQDQYNDLSSCGLDSREFTIMKANAFNLTNNTKDIYVGIASKLFLPLLEDMGDKLDGAINYQGLEDADRDYSVLLQAAATDEYSQIVGKILLNSCNKLVGNQDYAKHLIGLFGNRVATAIIHNKVKLSGITNGVDVLKALLILSDCKFENDVNKQPSQEEKTKYASFKALLDIAPEFIKSLKEKGGLNGLVKKGTGNGTQTKIDNSRRPGGAVRINMPTPPTSNQQRASSGSDNKGSAKNSTVKILKSGRKREYK